jgi:tetratricopeptide (TPR) repeat protein
MKRITWIAIPLVLLLWPGLLHAQSEELMQTYRRGQDQLQEGRYREAIDSFETALAMAEAELGPEDATTATLLNELAEVYRAQSRTAQVYAERLYKRALAVYERALGPEHPYVAASLNNLALLYEEQGHVAEAESHYRRSLGVLEQALGPEDSKVAASLNNLARLYERQGRYFESEALYARARGITAASGAAPPPGPAAAGGSAVYVTLKNANVRDAPASDGARLETLAKGTEVEILEGVAGGAWYRVGQGGRPIGFIHASLLAPSGAGPTRPADPPPSSPADPPSSKPADSPPIVMAVTLENARLRDAPTTDGVALATLPKGTKVALLARSDDGAWYQIGEGGQPVGFIHASTRSGKGGSPSASSTPRCSRRPMPGRRARPIRRRRELPNHHHRDRLIRRRPS